MQIKKETKIIKKKKNKNLKTKNYESKNNNIFYVLYLNSKSY